MKLIFRFTKHIYLKIVLAFVFTLIIAFLSLGRNSYNFFRKEQSNIYFTLKNKTYIFKIY